MVRALIADPDPRTQVELQRLFAGSGLDALVAEDGTAALRLALEEDVDVVIAELGLPEVDGLTLLRELRQRRPETAVILITAFGSVEDAVDAMRAGACDVLSKPFSDDQLRLSVDRTIDRLHLERENQQLRSALNDRLRREDLVTAEPGMHAVLRTVEAAANSRATVLLTGESGTGKSRIARAMHNLSDRSQGPFVEVNCGALPEALLESELFGHLKGAFTGADRARAGKFEAADGGTIFLDEIGTATPGLQVKLLRVLQERVIERVGDVHSTPVDVRVVLATNVDLSAEVARGAFREDLFYRINVVSIEIPPLRARRADIPLLAETFRQRFAADNQRTVSGFSPEAMRALCEASLPGNVRQLENIVERAVVLCPGQRIERSDLPADISTGSPSIAAAAAPPSQAAGLTDDAHLLPLKQALEGPERTIIERALAAHGGNRQQTARSLDINRSTLFNKMRKYGLL